MNLNIALYLLESRTHDGIIKNLRGKKEEGLSHHTNNQLLPKKTSFFSVRQQEERKIFLFSDIRVSKKDKMILKCWNRQWRLVIWPSMFMLSRKFHSITDFLFLFRPRKRWKIPHHIKALEIVILSRFQYITRIVW